MNWEGELKATTCYRDDPAHWYVKVADEFRDIIRTVEVDESVYNSCRRTAFWLAEQRCAN